MTRRRWPLALLLAVLLAAGLAIGLFSGTDEPGEAVSTPAPPAPATAPPQALQTPSLQSLAAAWQRPLFNPDRAPDAQGAAAKSGPDLGAILLTGVIIQGDHRVALFKQQGGASLTLKEGALLQDGWRIQRIEPRRVELQNTLNDSSQSRVLQLVTPRLPSAPPPGKTRAASP